MTTLTLRRMLGISLKQLGIAELPVRRCPIVSGRQQWAWKNSVSVRSYSKKINSFEFLHNDRLSLGLGDSAFGSFQKVFPQTVSNKLDVPCGILIPDYCSNKNGVPLRRVSKKPTIKTQEQLAFMREASKIARHVMDLVVDEVKPGVSTDELDKFAHNLIIKNKAYPSALGYKTFPKSICTSVNNIVCHGIPDDRKLVSGDIITIDVMAYKNGYHGDCAATALVGKVDELGTRLVDVAEACLIVGVQECGPEKPFKNIGKAIEKCAKLHGFQVIHSFAGHGIGTNIHEKPDVLHYDRENEEGDVLMKPGMTFTVEPVITQGMGVVMLLSDGWSTATVDGARAAQFEHTLHITESGIEILTDEPGPKHYVVK